MLPLMISQIYYVMTKAVSTFCPTGFAANPCHFRAEVNSNGLFGLTELELY